MGQENKYLANDRTVLELIAKLESINEDDYSLNQEYNNLEELIENEFLSLATSLNLVGTTKLYRDLVKVKEKLAEIINFPYLAKKKIVAVAGQSRVGKSSWINNLLGENYLPTNSESSNDLIVYITKGNSNQFLAYNIFNKKVAIEQEAIEGLSVLYQKYDLSFNQLIKSITFKTKDLAYENLVFFDLPTYKKALAEEELAKADYLIWVFDINKRSIFESDLCFLEKLNFSVPIFFILNKAEQQRSSRVKRNVKYLRRKLKLFGIKAAGIRACSTKERKVYFDNGLDSFLEKINQKDKESNLIFKVKRLFQTKINLYQKKIDLKKKKIEKLNQMNLLEENKEVKSITNDLLKKDKQSIKKAKIVVEKLKGFVVELEKLIKELLTKLEINHFNVEDKEKDLILAIKKNDFFLFKDLISEVDLDLKLKDRLLKVAKDENKKEIISFLKSKEQKRIKKEGQKLLEAIKGGDIRNAKNLIKEGTDINIRDREGKTPLMRAVYYDFVDLAEQLIKRGARINIKDKAGDSALTIAIANGNYDMVAKLVKNGANLRLKYEEARTTLMKAVLIGNKNIVELLLEEGANPDLEDNYGLTAFILAIQENNIEIVKILLDKGANPISSDNNGKTTIDYANEVNNEKIIALVQNIQK